jgi:hypothetical protein
MQGFFIWLKQLKFNDAYMKEVFSAPPVKETFWQKVKASIRNFYGSVTVLRIKTLRRLQCD